MHQKHDNDQSFLFRCDATPDIGLGHVQRCLQVAEKLSEDGNTKISFCTEQNSLGSRLITEHGFSILPFKRTSDLEEYYDCLDYCVDKAKPSVLILDIRDNLDNSTVGLIAAKHKLCVVVIDDVSDKRLAADIVFFPPIPEVYDLNWDGFEGDLCVGWEWVILGIQLDDDYLSIAKEDKSNNNSIFLSMGGSDKEGLTPLAMLALSKVKNIGTVYVVCGPEFRENQLQEIEDLNTSLNYKVEIITGTTDLSNTIKKCGIGVITFGVTAYELAALGVPSINIAISHDHYQHSKIFSEAGISQSLGLSQDLTTNNLSTNIQSFLDNKSQRSAMQQAGLKRLNSCGSLNVAKKIFDYISTN